MGIDAYKQGLQAEKIPFVEREPLAAHTTFRIGGPAAVFCTPQSAGQLCRALALCSACGVRHYLLGHGSNVLFCDEGFDGAIIALGDMVAQVELEGMALTAEAGASLQKLCRTAQQAGLTGLEFACGIPGTVGGAVYMNAGAYGGEMKDLLESVDFVDAAGVERTLPAAELALGYRTSIFEKENWAILRARMRLAPGDGEAIAARMAELLARRREKQPLEWPSAGSTFKRPEGAFAAALIEQCGLKGFRVGGAQVSEKHSGFVVNVGGATCADVLALTEEVRRVVQEKTGYVLEREIRVVR